MAAERACGRHERHREHGGYWGYKGYMYGTGGHRRCKSHSEVHKWQRHINRAISDF